MNTYLADDPLIRSLHVQQVADYLLLHGWVRQELDRVWMFQNNDILPGDSIRVVLTNNNQFKDTFKRIAEVVTTLAALRDQSLQEVVEEIVDAKFDVFQWRLSGERDIVSIPMDVASTMLKGLEDLLIYAACGEENPKPFYAKSTSTSKRYAQVCEFGHTRPGSFVFELKSPVSIALPQPQTLELDEDTFSRRVISRLTRGLASVQQATEKSDANLITEFYETGFNANLCETLTDMLEVSGKRTCDFLVKWSLAVTPEQDLKQRNGGRLDYHSIEILKAASRELREIKPEPNSTITGDIFRLGTDTDGNPDTIVLEANLRDQIRRVRVHLAPDDYRLACDAHRDKHQIRVTGTLEKVGRTWRLFDSRRFGVLK